MGYYTRFEGKISIDPPLTWREVKNSPYLPENAEQSGRADVKFDIQVSVEETDEGTMSRRWADGIVPLTDGQHKGYHIIEAIEGIIAAYPGHTFSGRFDCKGEDSGDMWRLVVRNGRVERVEPRIVWPDEES